MSKDDAIWDFRSEVTCPTYGPADTKIIFDDAVWTRNPHLLAPVKDYLWERRRGTAQHRPVSWQTIRLRYTNLVVFAGYMERLGITRWTDLTPPRWAQVVTLIPSGHSQSPILHQARGVLRVPEMAEAFYPIPVNRYRPKKQTPPIPNSVMREMIPAALAWEARIPHLLRLRRHFKKDDPWAVENDIQSKGAIKIQLGMAQTAAMILLLAATGMRVSELVSLKKADGQLLPRDTGDLWYVWGTVFKFHGTGCRVRWFGGAIGQRAYQMLCDLSPLRYLCVSLWYAPNRIATDSVAWRLQTWMKREGIALPSGKPLTPHQFRRTFVRQLFMHSAVTLLGLKDQLKHKKLSMTDYYVGCDAELHQALLGESPAKRSNQYAAEMAAALEKGDGQ